MTPDPESAVLVDDVGASHERRTRVLSDVVERSGAEIAGRNGSDGFATQLKNVPVQANAS